MLRRHFLGGHLGVDLQGRGDVGEVAGFLTVTLCYPLSTADCSTHLQSWESTILSPSLEGDCVWPDIRYRCSEDDVTFGHVCRTCRGLVIGDPCQPQGKDISFSYFAVN